MVADIVNAVFGLLFGIGLLLIAADGVHQWIPAIPMYAAALGIPTLLIFVRFVCKQVTLYHEYSRAANTICPHGVKGGQTLGLCSQCEKVKRDEEQRRLDELAEQQRKRAIKTEADLLRREELTQIGNNRLQHIEGLCSLEPDGFEYLIANLYRNLGYIADLTPLSNDGGIDVFGLKDDVRYAIQCKRFAPDKPVGRPLIQQLYAAACEAEATGVMVTTSRFTEGAIENAKQHGIELVDGQKLLKMIAQAFPAPKTLDTCRVMCLECGDIVTFPIDTVEKVCANGHVVTNDLLDAINGNLDPPRGKTCPRCGKPMRVVRGRFGKFWGCQGYPRCGHTERYAKPSRSKPDDFPEKLIM